MSDRKVIELKPIEVAIEDIQLKVTKLDMAIKELIFIRVINVIGLYSITQTTTWIISWGPFSSASKLLSALL